MTSTLRRSAASALFVAVAALVPAAPVSAASPCEHGSNIVQLTHSCYSYRDGRMCGSYFEVNWQRVCTPYLELAQ